MITLAWILFIVTTLTVGVIGLIYGLYLWILAIPYLLLIWFFWEGISSFGFLGFWTMLGIGAIPLAVLMDRIVDDTCEYFMTTWAVSAWLTIFVPYVTIEYWDVVKWVLGVSFFVGCAAVILASKGETQNA